MSIPSPTVLDSSPQFTPIDATENEIGMLAGLDERVEVPMLV